MKRISVVVLVLTMVVLVILIFVLSAAEKKAAQRTKAAVEIKEVIAAQYRTGRIDGGKPSEELIALAKVDPDFVMACYVLEEAKHFPKVPESVEKDMMLTARKDSALALEKVRRAVYDGLSAAMIASGKKSDQDRIGWVNNNPATAMIFLEWPLAERLGKKSEYIVSHLKGTYRDEPYWHAPVTQDQMQSWWWGKWPFEGEKAPIY